MALDATDARTFARELMLAMANSNSVKPIGASNSSGDEGNVKRGRMDATYLGSLYRELVNELQK